MASKIPTVKMHNGIEIPIIGLGTATNLENPNVNELKTAFRAAIDAGYRAFDTAAAYQNEHIIGEFLEELFKEGNIKRSDVYITTKLWPTEFRPMNVEKSIKSSLEKLRLDYIDLFLLHGPTPVKEEDGKYVTDLVPHIGTWHVLEKYYKAGTFKAIGISNFTIPQMEDLIQKAEVKPHNLQVECHACFPQYELHEFCKKNDITFTSFATLGSPTRNQYDPTANWGDASPMELPSVKEMAEKYKKSPGQILLRQMTQRGIIVIPRSTNPKRIHDNISIFDFSLTKKEMLKFTEIKENARLFLWEKQVLNI
uniref:NADP-dependent oxidoreductase domain-containing protein n=1 Tax=Panagrolaimus sp. ES5 TaxID=591445 RepID=A0AC34FC14_9BILA